MSGMSNRAAQRLVTAGRFLQSRKRRIIVQPGESYPAAVLRELQALPEAERLHLKGLVDWVEQYDIQAESEANAQQRAARGRR
ncbi:hypothetical protein [Paucibacter soli]|uniref:hypothetical protein n=1 Tax=Paucibacter soli TaxID=3133433 RepID=UPI0030A1D893